MMDQQQRLLANTAIMVVVLVGLVIVLFWATLPHTIACPDGERRRVNLRGFIARYADHPLDLEASRGAGAVLSKKLTPDTYDALARSARRAREIPRAVVTLYNGCRITLKDYFHLRERCGDLDEIARQIDELAARHSLDAAASKQLDTLVGQYIELVEELQ